MASLFQEWGAWATMTSSLIQGAVMLEQVLRIIDTLGERCKALLLFSAQGYKTREIAEWLKIPIGTAGRNMMDCRSKLDAALPV